MAVALHLSSIIIGITFSLGLLVTFAVTAFMVVEFNKLGDFPESLCSDSLLCFGDRSGFYALFQATLGFLSLILSIVPLWTEPTKYKAGVYRFLGGFHFLLAVASVIFLFFRLINMGILDAGWKDQGCKNPDIDGSPFERLFRYSDASITEKEQCTFNSFNQNLIVQSANTESAAQKIDWSNSDTYTVAQRQALIAAAASVEINYNDETMPYYHETYYWGCNSVCLSDRHFVNLLWLYLSAGAVVLGLTQMILSTLISQTDLESIQEPKNIEEGTKEEQKSLIQTPKEENDLLKDIELPDTGVDQANNVAVSSAEPSVPQLKFLL